MIELFGHPFSSYTWKARIAFNAFGLDHEFRMVDQDHPDNVSFVMTAHPAGKFPVMRIDGDVVVEATAIIEYLAATFEVAAGLIPSQPRLAAFARMLDRVFDNYVMANMQRVVSAYIANRGDPDPIELDAGRTGLLRSYRWLERWLTEHSFPPHVSLVSCAAAPALFYADWVERIPQDCPRVAALRAELLTLPPVVRCVEDARPYRAWFPPGAPDRD